MDPFDAIVGRLVLKFLPDTAATIGRLCGLLVWGGIMALQEPTWKICLAYTSHLPLRTAGFRRSRRRICSQGQVGCPETLVIGSSISVCAPPARKVSQISVVTTVRNFEACSTICLLPYGRVQKRSETVR